MPLKSLTKKQKKLKSKPWITKGIFTSIKKTTCSTLIIQMANKAPNHTLNNIQTS